MNAEKPFKSGYVAIIGKPNVGKSTVLNYLVGEKIAIVTEKPGTTRDKIMGVLSRDDAQIIFVDTPGIHKPRNLLGKHMTRLARWSLQEVNLIVLIIDAASGITRDDRIIFDLLKDVKEPAILLINKVDLVKKFLVLPLIDEASKIYKFKEIIPSSATKGDNMGVLLKKIIEYLPEGSKFFSDEQLTDKTERFMVGEMVREKALELTRQEIPHSIAVLVEEFKERTEKELIYIRATIFVEKPSQRKIVIGHKAQMLKKIGETARKDIEGFLNKHVYLDLWVKVYENWRKDPQALKMLGYM
jgi:GTP-binding protein Era